MRRFALVMLLAISACKKDDADTADTGVDTADTGADTATDTDTDTGGDTDTDGDTQDTQGDQGPTGFVGSPCETVADCDFDGAECLRDGYGGGMCSIGCDLYCEDRDGHPTTFCVDGGELEGDGADLGDGACHSRCDFGTFEETGCRPGYGCVVASRANQPSTEQFVCLPDRTTDLSDCYFDLADRGVPFEPTIKATEHPSGYPNLDCTIDDPVYLLPPYQGIDLEYYDGSPSPRLLVSCETAHAIADTVEDVKGRGVKAIRHIGTYNCRPISGTSTLSQHSFAAAIDIYGFEMTNGSVYTLIDDWEHETTDPQSVAAQFLYDAAYRWYDADIWNIILTPNYNSAHDNHFHVDLTPGGNYIGSNGNPEGGVGYVGPMEHDCGGPVFGGRFEAP